MDQRRYVCAVDRDFGRAGHCFTGRIDSIASRKHKHSVGSDPPFQQQTSCLVDDGGDLCARIFIVPNRRGDLIFLGVVLGFARVYLDDADKTR